MSHFVASGRDTMHRSATTKALGVVQQAFVRVAADGLDGVDVGAGVGRAPRVGDHFGVLRIGVQFSAGMVVLKTHEQLLRLRFLDAHGEQGAGQFRLRCGTEPMRRPQSGPGRG
jgi:hypothetical protein